MRMLTLCFALLLAFMAGCGGGAAKITNPEISGPYEFVVTSNVTGGTTLVEANFVASGNQSNAAGPSQSQVLTYENKIWYVNGLCAGPTPGQNTVAANIVAANNVDLAFNVGGNSFTGRGTLTGSTIPGNYSFTNTNCPNLVANIGYPPGFDSGGFIGSPVPDLAGTFSGVLNLPDGTANAGLTLQENIDHTLTVPTVLKGVVDNGNFTFSGSAAGSAMLVSGTVNGKLLSWLGYLDYTGRFTGTANSLIVFDSNTGVTLGLLLKQ